MRRWFKAEAKSWASALAIATSVVLVWGVMDWVTDSQHPLASVLVFMSVFIGAKIQQWFMVWG